MAFRYSVNQIIKDVDRKLHTGGTSLTSDFFGALDEGRRNMISKIQPTEMQRTAYIENALYDQIDKYACPSDLQYENVVEIKKLSSTRNVDTQYAPLELVYSRRFDQKRQMSENIFSVNYDSGVKYMRIYHPAGLRECQHLVLNDMNSLTQNGTWNVGGNLVNLTIDHLNFITGKGSFKFDFNDSGTTGFIESTDIESVNILEYFPTGSIFTWLNISEFQKMTSVKITFGSDTSNYYEFTVNQPHDNNQFVNGWNLLKYSLAQANMVGTPNPKAITYLRFDFTTTGQVMYNCNLDNVVARKGVVYQVVYESAYCFVDPGTLAWKQFATQNTDFISLEEDSYQLLMLETAMVILQEAYGNTNRANDDIVKMDAQIQKAYIQYRRLHKTEAIDPYQTGYIFGNQYDGYTDFPIEGYGSYNGNQDNNQQQ